MQIISATEGGMTTGIKAQVLSKLQGKYFAIYRKKTYNSENSHVGL
jgi:hypothetical protein